MSNNTYINRKYKNIERNDAFVGVFIVGVVRLGEISRMVRER